VTCVTLHGWSPLHLLYDRSIETIAAMEKKISASDLAETD
jgi:hypothetical protein